MIINHNISALNTYRNLTNVNNALQKSLERLSSGLRINRSADDAAGLAISEKMRGQIRGLNQAVRNAQDAISMIQTAEGALNETHSILQRMRELAVQAANNTNTETDRAEIQKEINQLVNEIDRIANTTEFNTQKLLDGTKVGLRDKIEGSITLQNNSSANITATVASTDQLSETGTIIITRVSSTSATATTDFIIGDPLGLGITMGTTLGSVEGFGTTINITNLDKMQVGESVVISVRQMEAAKTDASKAISSQIGANSGQNILIGINSMRAEDLGVRNASTRGAIDVTSYEKATAAITAIDNAISLVSTERSKLGAFQNRLEHTIANLSVAKENLTAAESRIRDLDMAEEMMTFTKNQIISQAATAMLAQANQVPAIVLQLLR